MVPPDDERTWYCYRLFAEALHHAIAVASVSIRLVGTLRGDLVRLNSLQKLTPVNKVSREPYD
jgi:hypothetical protein